MKLEFLQKYSSTCIRSCILPFFPFNRGSRYAIFFVYIQILGGSFWKLNWSHTTLNNEASFSSSEFLTFFRNLLIASTVTSFTNSRDISYTRFSWLVSPHDFLCISKYPFAYKCNEKMLVGLTPNRYLEINTNLQFSTLSKSLAHEFKVVVNHTFNYCVLKTICKIMFLK